jgi:DNA-binding transcriptional regulator YiaG
MKKTVTFNHLGFPIELIDWPHIEVSGELVPDVNYSSLEDIMFQLLPLKSTRLSGAEIKFIRHHLEMTQKKFASWLEDETDHSTVAKWERADLEPTGMSKSMERSLRMQLIAFIFEKQRKHTVRIQEIMEKLTRSISVPISKPPALNSKSFFPIPKRTPRLYA